MKTHQLIIALALFAAPTLTFAQKGKSSEKYHEEKMRVRKAKTDTSDVTAILKDSANAETGPILNDNGNVNSTGTIDGSRSSTGRPDADTTTSYTVKKTVRTMTPAQADSLKKRKKP
ncbi:hypothetical protein [Dyadobacter luticola]|uniref:Uncharacterized protein n=1 Tax=Dyadobacter luticola TaxID=1979387 RepID=A0A5R9L2D8_9BACT|nr:hypothetical protein [Dyadobacter luticola]TLV02568.1 hypothetical protein FEN17_02810 [Dyadobacter luticola]